MTSPHTSMFWRGRPGYLTDRENRNSICVPGTGLGTLDLSFLGHLEVVYPVESVSWVCKKVGHIVLSIAKK